MRILIYTLPQWANYGGILQSYALQTVLEKMGHSVKVLASKHEMPVSYIMWVKAHIKRILHIGDLGKGTFDKRRYNEANRIIDANTSVFVKKYIHQDFREPNGIREGDYDAIVVGSDQIWRPLYNVYPICEAFLSFAKDWDIKRIAYSASFGTSDWEYNENQTTEAAELIKKFDAISVRESSAIGLCKKYLGVEATHLLDPTMLLEKSDYEALVGETPKSNGELFTYILDRTEEKTKLIKKISTEKKLKVFHVDSLFEDWGAPVESRVQPPIEQWLRGFMDAQFVVTDSFHGCVFSIIFGVPFVVVGNQTRGMARFSSLLEMFGLEDHLIKAASDFDVNKDYSLPQSVFDKRMQMQSKSLRFLESNLFVK